MSSNKEIEDYGGPDGGTEGGEQQADKYSGGLKKGDGGQFGELGDTGVGTDLTMTMGNTDPGSGLIKGGQTGGDDVAGPAQYGGEAGDLSSDSDGGSASKTEGMPSTGSDEGGGTHGHFGGDASNLSERPTHSEG